MTDLPLHPVIVHLPLALALLMPAFALLGAWGTITGRLTRRSWVGVIALQALLAAGALAAMTTGQRDEERVEAVVGETPLEQHEGYAGQFAWSTGVVLGLMLAGLVPHRTAGRAAVTVATVATVAVALLGIRTGHAGGQLVYRHGAAAAFAAPSPGLQSVPGERDRPHTSGTDDEHHD